MDRVFETFQYLHDSRASDFGLMKIDNKGRVLSFSEKPKGADLKAMVSFRFCIAEQTYKSEWLSTNAYATFTYTSGSRHDGVGAFEGRGFKETIHCFNGSVCLQEGDTFEPFKVLLAICIISDRQMLNICSYFYIFV